jgi:DnaK suppressor protein
MDRDTWKEVLENELIGVNREIAALRRDIEPEELQSMGDNTPFSEDVDAAVTVENRELNAQILDRLVLRAAALEDALARVDDGTYGICIDCEEKISEKRLAAMPEALRCARDQEEVEADRERAESRNLRSFDRDYQRRRKIERAGELEEEVID